MTDVKPAIERMKVCIECEHFRKPLKQCKLCGCFMPIKVRIPTMMCPINRW